LPFIYFLHLSLTYHTIPAIFRLIVPPSEKHNPAVEDPVSNSEDAAFAAEKVVVA
jgi:hypothetical protein